MPHREEESGDQTMVDVDADPQPQQDASQEPSGEEEEPETSEGRITVVS